MASSTPFKEFRPAALARWMCLVALALLLIAPAFVAAESRDTISCEADLTCSKSTKMAQAQRFSAGPDLSKWEPVGETGSITQTASRTQGPKDSWRDPVTRMAFNLVPGACYRVPDQESETGAAGGKAAAVCVDSFYLGTYEVTFEEYDRFARDTARELPDDEGWGRGCRPVINVSVYDALNFAKWLSRKTGQHFRLPTETEWEHAARAGSRSRFPWDDDIGRNRANCDGCGSRWDDEKTAPVGSFAPNAWGFYDMVGNVGEWTCSMRDPDPAQSFERCDSIYETRRRVYRNGGWSDDPGRLALAFRDWNAAMRRTDDVGFRLVRECRHCGSRRPEIQAGIGAQRVSEEVAKR